MSTESIRTAVDNLVLLAQLCGFEGWFFNVECSLSEEKIPMLKSLVGYLKERIHLEIPGGLVIWYDSITREGRLSWQNKVNQQNKMFFDVCDGIFLNYNWNLADLMSTRDILKENKIQHREFEVYFGLDVFGRGQVGKLLSDEVRKINLNFKLSNNFCKLNF